MKTGVLSSDGLQSLIGRRFRFERKIVPAHTSLRVVVKERVADGAIFDVVEVEVPERIEMVPTRELRDDE